MKLFHSPQYYLCVTSIASMLVAIAVPVTSRAQVATPVEPCCSPVASTEPLTSSQPISTRASDLQIPPIPQEKRSTETSLPPIDLSTDASGRRSTETSLPALASSTDSPLTPPLPHSPTPTPPFTQQGIRVAPAGNEGVTIERTYIYLTNPTGDAARDEEIKRDIAETFGLRAGGSFSTIFASKGISQVQRLPFVKSAEYRLYESVTPGRVTIAVIATIQPAETKPAEQPKQPRGILVEGNFRQFPTLYESDSALFKVILNGSMGVFSDTDPWFANPQAFLGGSYRPFGTTTWGEFSLEPGLAGISQVGKDPFYLYGAFTYTISGTIQPDVFTTDNRFYGAVEKLYAGLLYARKGFPYAFNLSGGRQTFQLNQGFLFSQFSGSANALERGASYLNPRVAYQSTVLTDVRAGNWRLRGFFLQPDELAIADSKTQYLGTSISYNNNRNLDASLSYINVIQSDKMYFLPNGQIETRQGLQVINPQIRLTSLFGVDGLWAEAEYAYEFSNQFNMSANAGYIWVGYKASKVSWRPSISYRFAGFSGDNPRTAAYERFDTLQSGGLSDWLQGLSLGKVFTNSNSFTHRISLGVQPSESFSLSLDYYYRYADQLNNLGGSRPLQVLQSRYIGQEIQLLGRYFVSQNFLLQALTAIAFPGSAIQRAVPNPTEPWFTFQISAYMFFQPLFLSLLGLKYPIHS